MAGDMWDGGLLERGFSSLWQFITALPQAVRDAGEGERGTDYLCYFGGGISKHRKSALLSTANWSQWSVKAQLEKELPLLSTVLNFKEHVLSSCMFLRRSHLVASWRPKKKQMGKNCLNRSAKRKSQTRKTDTRQQKFSTQVSLNMAGISAFIVPLKYIILQNTHLYYFYSLNPLTSKIHAFNYVLCLVLIPKK